MSTEQTFQSFLIITPFCGNDLFDFAEKHKEIEHTSAHQFTLSQFPENMIDHIRNRVNSKKPTVTNNDSIVREAMNRLGIKYFIVSPSLASMSDYVKDMWLATILERQDKTRCVHIELKSGQHIVDRIELIDDGHGNKVFKEKHVS